MKIAMWSGPRNLSTAMMYSFGARTDCAVWDEPFYAAYLKATDLDHPMRDEILADGQQDPDAVIADCLGPTPDGRNVFYQKHMTQHMIPEFDRSWLAECINIFLIRDPARVIASYSAKRENPTLDDIGFWQQAELFDQVCQTNGTAPPVIDSYDIRVDPEGVLRKLCTAIDLPFQPQMLRWPGGGHKDDGVWAQHWYGSVWTSTGFAAAEGPVPAVDPALQSVWRAALPHYQKLEKYKL